MTLVLPGRGVLATLSLVREYPVQAYVLGKSVPCLLWEAQTVHLERMTALMLLQGMRVSEVFRTGVRAHVGQRTLELVSPIFLRGDPFPFYAPRTLRNVVVAPDGTPFVGLPRDPVLAELLQLARLPLGAAPA